MSVAASGVVAMPALAAAPWQQQRRQQSTASTTGSSAQPPPSPQLHDHHQHPLARLVAEHFPPITYGFAYGSGVFDQPDLPASGDNAGATTTTSTSSSTATSTSSNTMYSSSSSSRSSSSTNSNNRDRPMVDFIFVVDDPEEWHALNLERNASHYSALRRLGPAALAAAGERLGAGVYFNTLVALGGGGGGGGADGRLVKYGVTSRAAFLEDVTTWRHLYVPGRLHKPVLPLVDLPGAAAGPGTGGGGGSGGGGSSGGSPAATAFERQLLADRRELAAALEENLIAALRTALVLTPPGPEGAAGSAGAAAGGGGAGDTVAAFRDVVRRVVGLSYHGDVRMGLAEDSRKVERIVAGSWGGLCAMYAPLLRRRELWRPAGDLGAGGGGSGGGGGSQGGRGGEGGGGRPWAWVEGAAAAAPPDAAAAAARLVVRQDASLEARMAMVSQLPAALLLRVADRVGVKRRWAAAAAMQVPPSGTLAAAEEAAAAAASAPAAGAWPHAELVAASEAWRRDVAWATVRSGRAGALLHAGLASIIRASSARQAAVGLLSAGAVKSARYLAAKLAKAWRPR